MRFLSLSLSLLLMILANQAQAWWNVPYGYSPNRMGYWPSVWPAYVQPQQQYNQSPYGGWNVKGTMNQRGDTHFVIEYHGNIYNQTQFGNGYSAYGGYPGSLTNQNTMNGWRR